jgi:hypothetical protein
MKARSKMNPSSPPPNTIVIPPSHPLYGAIMETGKKRARPFMDVASPPPQPKKSRVN